MDAAEREERLKKIPELVGKLHTMHMLKLMCKLYSDYLTEVGPEQHDKHLNDVSTSIWTEIGKETFDQVELVDIHNAVMTQVADILSQHDLKFDEIKHFFSPFDPEMLKDKEGFKDTIQNVMGLNDRLKGKEAVTEAVVKLITAGGKLIAHKTMTEFTGTVAKREKFMEYFREISTVKVAQNTLGVLLRKLQNKRSALRELESQHAKQARKGSSESSEGQV